ncbi:MAG: hypothetical protein U5L03_10445 [Burkholderiaceae bacterium]|nr:hypothetical protein [Burkholderiaceae bacterium]
MRRSLHVAAITACLAVASAAAQTRWVIVNGERLGDAQVARLARIQCTEIPDGAYWLNERSGAWGYAGNPQVQGYLGDLCRGGQAGAMNRDGTYGPFVTMRRAQEEANKYRQRGLSSVAFHNGDGYYVRVSR